MNKEETDALGRQLVEAYEKLPDDKKEELVKNLSALMQASSSYVRTIGKAADAAARDLKLKEMKRGGA